MKQNIFSNKKVVFSMITTSIRDYGGLYPIIRYTQNRIGISIILYSRVSFPLFFFIILNSFFSVQYTVRIQTVYAIHAL